MASFRLPTAYLSQPKPDIEKKAIDFSEIGLPEYQACYACVLDNVLTATECQQLLQAAEATTNGQWEEAMINFGGGRQGLAKDVRDCGRIIWDDREVVAKIWDRCRELVPEIFDLSDQPGITGGYMKKGRKYELTRLNERMRFLKYVEGNYFRPHFDGSFATAGNEEVSFITMHLYLNEADEQSQLQGGATTFHAPRDWDGLKRGYDVAPKVGRVLLFQHKGLMHSGADVSRGVKYTMRTDVMYKRIG